jgi:YjjG family noncanonical pyrimidine nucleotidase
VLILLAVARRYEWLLFDADGTLFDYERAERSALESSFGQIGLPFAADYLARYRQINAELWRSLERGDVAPAVLKVRRFEQLLEAIGAEGSAAELSALYLQCLADCSELIDGAFELLEGLRQHYRFAILTNGLSAVQRPRLARSAIQPHISEMVISEEVGCAKPAVRFFELTFERLGFPPRNNVLMVGDNWSSDIQGAAHYGLDTCWFNPGHAPRPGAPAITHEIRSLRELAPWLRQKNGD